ncbi:MAG TPA: thioredoxin family protein [Vicinamibacterales bacterium]|jgi:glutaredoxin-like protein|nr:thioredoxin family protein [Vicinamibacterales bacterium]
MALLSEQDRTVVSARLAAIKSPVTVLLFTQTIDAPDTVLVAKQVLDEVTSLSDLISLEQVNFILEKERAAQYGIEGIPALVLLRGEEDSRIRFLGAPGGYEFVSLIEALVLAGTGESGLTPESKALVAAHVTTPTDILVFVTPSCPHCPRAVTLAHRLAVESPLIRATCVEATEFIDLAQRYQVTGVPKTVVNGTIEMLGALPESVFVRTAVGAPAPP